MSDTEALFLFNTADGECVKRSKDTIVWFVEDGNDGFVVTGYYESQLKTLTVLRVFDGFSIVVPPKEGVKELEKRGEYDYGLHRSSFAPGIAALRKKADMI